MERYLSRRVEPPKRKEKVSEEEFEREEEGFQEKPFFQNVIDMVVGEEEKEEREGIFARVRNWLFVSEDGEEVIVEEERVPMLPEDLKETLRIANSWLGKLPAKSMRQFKQSDDYTIYKQTLEQYGLVKSKEE